MKCYYDLHIHSALSPCGEDDMTPNNIVRMSKLKGLNIIAVSDHNSVLNAAPVIKLAKDNNILCVPAMELETKEEVHILCLFPDLAKAKELEDLISKSMPKIQNNPKIYKPQYIIDENDNIIGEKKELLSVATTIGIYEIISYMNEIKGLAIPAHIDRSSYSILSNLGFISPDLDIKCVEIYNKNKYNELKETHKYLSNLNIIYNSDAHRLGDISEKSNFLDLEKFNIRNLFDKMSKKLR